MQKNKLINLISNYSIWYGGERVARSPTRNQFTLQGFEFWGLKKGRVDRVGVKFFSDRGLHYKIFFKVKTDKSLVNFNDMQEYVINELRWKYLVCIR